MHAILGFHSLEIRRAMMGSKWSNNYLLLLTKTFLLVVDLRVLISCLHRVFFPVTV